MKARHLTIDILQFRVKHAPLICSAVFLQLMDKVTALWAQEVWSDNWLRHVLELGYTGFWSSVCKFDTKSGILSIAEYFQCTNADTVLISVLISAYFLTG